MIPEGVRRKAEEILRNKDFSELDGDEVVVEQKEDGIFYAFVKSKKRGSFGHIIIGANDLSFLWGSSGMDPSVLLERYKSGVRSMPSQTKKTRRNVRLPVIRDEATMLDFSKKMANTFIELFDEQDNDHNDPLENEWYRLIYNALVLLLSPREHDTKLIFLTMVYESPRLVKTYLRYIKERDVYDYWTVEVPKFMKQQNAKELISYFNIRIASLIGEQEIQDLCKNYRG